MKEITWLNALLLTLNIDRHKFLSFWNLKKCQYHYKLIIILSIVGKMLLLCKKKDKMDSLWKSNLMSYFQKRINLNRKDFRSLTATDQLICPGNSQSQIRLLLFWKYHKKIKILNNKMLNFKNYKMTSAIRNQRLNKQENYSIKKSPSTTITYKKQRVKTQQNKFYQTNPKI